MASLTIGLPVYNGAKTLARALDNMLAQTHTDFVAIISDNGSTDETPAICRAYAERDGRIRYIRQPENLVWNENFRAVLMLAESPYFMWMTHDDIWHPQYAERNISRLAADSGSVCSVSQISYFDADGNERLSTDTGALKGGVAQRLRDYFLRMDSCGRLYGVYRTNVLKKSFPAGLRVFGADWLIVGLTLLYGEHSEIKEVLLRREEQPAGHYFRRFGITDRFKPAPFEIFWPLRRMHRELRLHLSPDLWKAVQGPLRYLDLRMVALAIDYRVPVLRPILTPLRSAMASTLHRRWRLR